MTEAKIYMRHSWSDLLSDFDTILTVVLELNAYNIIQIYTHKLQL